MTYGLEDRCSIQLNYENNNGGQDRIRTYSANATDLQSAVTLQLHRLPITEGEK